MTVYAITNTKKGRTGIAPTYLHVPHNFWLFNLQTNNYVSKIKYLI